MTATEILSSLQKKQYKPIYFLHGKESYYIDLISDFIEKNVLNDAEKGFNQSIVYGKDVDLMTIISTAKRFPMMAPYQVVIVKEAQNIKKWDDLAAYADNPSPTTILVFAYKYGTADKRLKVFKSIEKSGLLFESKELYDNQLPQWINDWVAAKQYKINPKATSLLADYLGNDLEKIANELEKLLINLPKGQEIGTKDIEQNIGISKEYNVFELTGALGVKDQLKAFKIVQYMAANPKSNPLVLVMGNLFNFFQKVILYHDLKDKSKTSVATTLKINPYFTGDYEVAAKNYSLAKTIHIIRLLRTYDLKSKGVDSTGNVEDGELLKELVYQILN